MKINRCYEKSIGDKKEDFLEFLNNNDNNIVCNDSEIDFLVQKIAQNLFYFEDNIATAKSDYITLLNILVNKGYIFKDENRADTIENIYQDIVDFGNKPYCTITYCVTDPKGIEVVYESFTFNINTTVENNIHQLQYICDFYKKRFLYFLTNDGNKKYVKK